MSEKSKLISMKSNTFEHLMSFITEKEKSLIVFDISKELRNKTMGYYSLKKIATDKKSIVNCIKGLKSVIKSINEFKFIANNHSESLEESLKKYIETYNYFCFFRAISSIPIFIFPNLTELDLNHFNIGYDGILLLNTYIKTTKLLKNLNLGYNNLGDDGCSFLKIGLDKNNSIVSLILECNCISDYGLEFLIPSIINHSKLKVLKMCLNVITIDGLKELVTKLSSRTHPPIQILDFKHNNVVIKEENTTVFKENKIIF